MILKAPEAPKPSMFRTPEQMDTAARKERRDANARAALPAVADDIYATNMRRGLQCSPETLAVAIADGAYLIADAMEAVRAKDPS